MTAINQDNTYIGKFWLPHKGEDSAAYGMMVLHKNGATVHLHDALTQGHLEDSVVFAELKGPHRRATLLNCYDSWIKDSNGEVIKYTINSTLTALGCTTEIIETDTLTFRIPGSERWLNDNCFHVMREDLDVAVRFKPIEHYKGQLTPVLMMTRTYAATISSGTSGIEVYSVERRMHYELRSRSKLLLGRCWTLIWSLQKFFEFVTQSHLSYENVEIHHDDLAAGHKSRVLIHNATTQRNRNEPNPINFLVHAHEIDVQTEELIGRWVRLIDANPAPFEHYFHAFDRAREDRVLHFVWNVAALEELHKMRYRREKRDLLYRLREMVQRWKGAFDQPPDDQVLQHIKDSRHYHAHAASDLREKAAKGWLLLRYGDFLMALSSLELLSHLGFEQNAAITLTRHSQWMREALNLTTHPGSDE
ncbi:hypothetical protein [Coralloluteibacterium thermophilus]|uniref:ApeA N-terminal domain-containing protein n=1 Tax=Coralloluteibacterium thermophilum TaxID=2707049 RepID=A0ABV9NJK7_9GAMM